MDVDTSEAPAALDARLDGFLERLTPSSGRPGRRRQARTYVAGLLLEGERKSVQPLAGRLGATDNGQALHHFVAHSPWACEGLLAAMAQEAARLWPKPHAWIIDETSFPKAGRHSVGVAPQHCGALGKIANCQVAVSLHYAAGTLEQAASAALGWRLFLPREWVEDAARRQKAGVPASVTYRSKNTLALELVDEALARGLPPAPVLADSDYGDDYRWRAALRQRGVGYCVAVEPRAKAWTSAPLGSPPPAAGRPVPRGTRCPPPNAWTRSRASCPPVLGVGSSGERARGDPCRDVLRGWPSGRATATPSANPKQSGPASGSLSSGPRTNPRRLTTGSRNLGGATRTPTLKLLVGLARERWRVEQDYRELKDELGLDHFEGRSWPGWHPHVALTCLAHLFLQSERRRPPTKAAQKKPGRSALLRKPAADAPPPARPPRAQIMRSMSLVPDPLQHLIAQ